MQKKNKEPNHGKNATRSEVPEKGSIKVDELGIERGQNGEKGNTVRPENVRDEKEAAH